MPIYIFASTRGNDFEIEGKSPLHALMKLRIREAEEGTLWRLNDDTYNRFAIKHRGFRYLDQMTVAYKEKER
jgi:hypothetical protein